MSSTAITLHLPKEILAHFQHTASQSQRSLEDVMVETLLMYSPVTSTNISEWLDAIPAYTDSQLWAVVRLQPDAFQDNQRITLTQKSKQALLTPLEAEQLEQLLDDLENLVLLRSKAITLLKERGYNVAYFFNL